MKNFNVRKAIKEFKENYPFTFLNINPVAKETAKCKIKYQFKTRSHNFACGEKGEVADKLIIEVDFGRAVIQPHTGFEDDFCMNIVEAIQDNVNGIYENQDH